MQILPCFYSAAASAIAEHVGHVLLCNQNKTNKELFGTAAVRDALVQLCAAATTPESADWVASAINNITINTANQQLFGTAAVRDALVQLCAAATTPESARWVASAITNITINTANQELFGTAAVRDASSG
jgi:L-rhamnose mutarotase